MKKTYVSFLGTGTYKPCVYLKPDAPASDSGVVTYVQTAMRKLVACGAEKRSFSVRGMLRKRIGGSYGRRLTRTGCGWRRDREYRAAAASKSFGRFLKRSTNTFPKRQRSFLMSPTPSAPCR